MFEVLNKPIDGRFLTAQVKDDQAGAFVCFAGHVRNQNEGKAVQALEYEVYHELAYKEADQIIKEAQKKFSILKLRVVHREGQLEIGDMAVWVGVATRHRAEAFAACRYIIDEIKQRLPVWKREHYADEAPQWVNCHGCGNPHTQIAFTKAEFYARQTILKFVGDRGQDKLNNASVLVVGAGGLGTPALTYLAASGIGHITICDGDRLEVSNLHRQTLYRYQDIGLPKARLACLRLAEMNPFIQVRAVVESFTAQNARDLVAKHDVVLDCTDNFKAKFLIHDACYFESKPLVQASIYQSEGQLQVFIPDDPCGCLRCLWADQPEAACVGTCADVGVLGPVPGVLGTLQSYEAIKLILNLDSSARAGVHLIDLVSQEITKIKRVKNPDCPLCGASPTIRDVKTDDWDEWDLDMNHVSVGRFKQFIFVDIREASERNQADPCEQSLMHIPKGDFQKLSKIDSSNNLVLVCKKGLRSRQRAAELRQNGFGTVYSLSLGIEALKSNWKRLTGNS